MWKAIRGYLVRSKANDLRKALRNMESCGGDLDSPLWGVYVRRLKKDEVVYEPTEALFLPVTFEVTQKMAYYLAENDNFTASADDYWRTAEEHLRLYGLSAIMAQLIGHKP